MNGKSDGFEKQYSVYKEYYIDIFYIKMFLMQFIDILNLV